MGVATYKFKVSHLGLMASEAAGLNYIRQEIKDIEAALPFQPTLIKQKEEPIDLCLEITLFFEHPTFIDGSEIKDLREWKRAIAFDEDGKIYQYNKNIGTLNYEDFLRETPNWTESDTDDK